jgi:hypothetical protein
MGSPAFFLRCPSSPFVFTLGSGHDRVEAGRATTGIVLITEPGYDLVGNNPAGNRIGKRPLQLASDLNSDFAILKKDKQNRGIVTPTMPDPPASKSLLGKILQYGVRGQLRENREQDLVRGPALELLQRFIP